MTAPPRNGEADRGLEEGPPVSLLSPLELLKEKDRLSLLLDEALADLYLQTRRFAESENTYRLARANAYLAASGTVNEREAHVDKATSKERVEAHLSKGLMEACRLNVRAKLAQLSAWQTGSTLSKTEMEMAR